MTWPRGLASYWHNYVPPCRPSRFELDVCSSVLGQIREKSPGRRPTVAILGSTAEYRDWAYEEHCTALVIDSSREFHDAISHELRHKNRPQEQVVFRDWREMDHVEVADMVVGDLVVGNVAPHEVEDVVARIATALRPGGALLSKSVFYGVREPLFPSVRDLCLHYEAEWAPRDPFPLLAYDLTIACTDRKTKLLRFADMLTAIEERYACGDITAQTIERYRGLGWDREMKFPFYVMPLSEWIAVCNRYFVSVEARWSPYAWGSGFPYYVCRKEAR